MIYGLWPAHSSSIKIVQHHWKKIWRLPHNLVFVFQVEMDCNERGNVKYFWYYSIDFLKTFITCCNDNWLSNKKLLEWSWRSTILLFHHFSILTRDTAVCDKNILSGDRECSGQGCKSYKCHISTIIWPIITQFSPKWFICEQQSNSCANCPLKYMSMSQFTKDLIFKILFDRF